MMLSLSLSFLQQRDLTRVVKIVLNHTLQQEVDRVNGAGNDVRQPRVVQSADRFTQSFVVSSDLIECVLPRLVTGVLDSRPVFVIRNVNRSGLFNPSSTDPLP